MPQKEIATFAGGCFWCTEAIFTRLKGVEKTISGYAGGKMEKPSYEQVSRGDTGHAEAIQITYDPKIISFEDLLYIFWRTHDPTTLNRQGADVGAQYRSVIFYHDEEQKQKVLASKEKIEKEGINKNPIVTEIVPFESFHEAENYHQNYYSNNSNKSYCRIVIDPKINKLQKDFKKYLK